jgi:hypothetical protein
MSGKKEFLSIALRWTIRNHRFVELVECFLFDCSYMLFGVWITMLRLLQVLVKKRVS